MNGFFKQRQIDLRHLFAEGPELFKSPDAFWDLREKRLGEIDHAGAFGS